MSRPVITSRRSFLARGLSFVPLATTSWAPFTAFADKHPSQQASQSSRPVLLDLVALDNRGEPVTDLLARDLQVTDNGKRQEVRLFRRNFPTSLTSGTRAPHEYSNREHPAPPATVILLDFMNDRTMSDATIRNELVHALEGQETSAGLYLYILTNRGNLIPIHPLPGPESGSSIDEHWTQQIQARLDPVIKEIFSARPIEDWDPGYRFSATLNAASAFSGQIAMLPGRKNLVWVTHGVPIALPDLSGEMIDLSPQINQFSTSLERAHIAVYTVDQSSKGAAANVGSYSTQALEDVSDLTGGRYYGSDAVEIAINQARMDSRASYTLGYFTSPQSDNGKFHKIRVSSSRHGLRLNTKRGYYPYPDSDSADRQSTAIRAGIGGLFESSQIGLWAKVEGGDPQPVRLKVRIDPEDILFRPLGDRLEGDLLLAVFPSTEEAPGRAEEFAMRPEPLTALPIHLSMTQEERNEATQGGPGIKRDMVLENPRRQVRLVVVDQNSGMYGSLQIPTGAQP